MGAFKIHESDDFAVFAGSEHMFYGLDEPFELVRSDLEENLRSMVSSAVLSSIKTTDEPKFLTLAAKTEDPDKVEVAHFAFCFRATLEVASDEGAELLDATITYMFADVNQPGGERSRSFCDLQEDAEEAFTRGVFGERFLAFRYENAEEA